MVEFRNQSFVTFDGCFNVFAECVRTVAVHGHLAYQGTHAGFLIQFHQQTGTFRMDGAENATAHGAKKPLGVKEMAVHFLGIMSVGILRLFGEGVILQPRQEFQVHRHALVAYLGGMNVHVVHGRYQQAVAEINDLCVIAI